jgi:hypothetical protein
MVVNIGLDVTLGALPFLGDAFDAWFKVNRRNYNVIMRYSRSPHLSREKAHDWLFLLGVTLLLLVILSLPMLVLLLLWSLVHR